MSACRVKTLTSVIVVVTTLATSVPVASAQPPAAQPPRAAGQQVRVPGIGSLFETGRLAGLAEAERVDTRGKAALGALAGFSIYGTLGVFAIGPAPLTSAVREKCSQQPPEYQRGFREGWDQRSRGKKRRAFMTGALIGFVGGLDGAGHYGGAIE